MSDYPQDQIGITLTAGGSVAATPEQEPCWATYIGGHSAIFRCALPFGHDGWHESWSGTGWD